MSAFATTARLVLAQEAVPDKRGELAAIPLLLERLGADDGLKGALVSIDAIATNAEVARAIAAKGADWLLAVKANQPTLRAEVEAAFAEAPAATLDTFADLDKGHGRLEERRMTVLRDTGWLDGPRRFPGELRLPGVACLLHTESRVEAADRCRSETRYFVSSRPLTAAAAAEAVRAHWAIENRLHWGLDVTLPTTSPASARATAPETWPPSDTSPSTSSAPPRTSDRSSPDARSLDGIPTTSTPSSPHVPHNLDSEP